MNEPETSKRTRCALDDLFDRGRLEGARWFVERLMRQRFGDLPAVVTTRLADAPLPDLERWNDRLLTAPSPEAVVELA